MANNLILCFYILRTLVYIFSPIEKIAKENPDFFSAIRVDAYSELLLVSVFFFGLAFARARKETTKLDIKIFNYVLFVAPALLIFIGILLSNSAGGMDSLQMWVFVDLFFTFYSFVMTVLLFLNFANHLNSWNISALFFLAIYIYIISLFEANLALFEILRTLPYFLMSIFVARKRKSLS